MHSHVITAAGQNLACLAGHQLFCLPLAVQNSIAFLRRAKSISVVGGVP